jgi:hypothetical protein
LESFTKDQLIELFFLHVRNIWRVDGLYFLGIEKRFGTEPAREIDADCWKAMGKIEARRLKESLKVEKINPSSLIYILRNTSWFLDALEKVYETSENKAIIKIIRCRTQETRIRKDLGVFPCKKVRQGYLQAFTEELDPSVQVICKACPPDKHPSGAWCEWEFIFRLPG